VPLARFARATVGNARVAALLEDVWLVQPNDLGRCERGLLVTREGHGYAPERGELWFAGEAAESVLLALHARRGTLAGEVESLERELAAASKRAAAAAEAERATRAGLQRARAAASRLPPVLDPREPERLEALWKIAETLTSSLAGGLAAGARFEAPLTARVDAGGARSGELGEELRRLGASESELRRAASEAAERLSAIGVETARLEAERDEVCARLPEETGSESLSEEEGAALEATASRLERRREALGQVNPLAAEEHARESERLTELARQREDLERSLAELEKLRAELTETLERRFAETYGAVERHFAEVAATLFPGGRGRLALTVEDEGGEPGVEIELQPAGKRITRLSLLSGGEKALGAISFLFALFLARPCPFYLLDEVEAALDDTNIGRFIDLLRRFSDRAQFIVVTHQKRTMEAADILYGVTMGADGISQIVSKRLPAEPARARSA
jgi:chromosome segregation protein